MTIFPKDLIVKPNPINEELILNLPEMDKNYQLYLVDVTGKRVMQINGNSANLQQNLRNNVSQLAQGIYLLKISGDGFSKTQLINK